MYILAYLLRAGTVEPERQPLLGSGSEKTLVSRQRHETDNRRTSVDRKKILNKQEYMVAARERLDKRVPAATDTLTRIDGFICAGRGEEF
jgi:hypothetical protein